MSRIDYCNCLLAGAPAKITDKLQSVMNAAAKIVCGLKKYDHIVQHMRDTLHWLPVPQRVTYKLCLLTYKKSTARSPNILSNCANRLQSRNLRRRLRSSSPGDLLVPMNIPHRLLIELLLVPDQEPGTTRRTKTLDTFKKHLKTFLFKQAYG